MPRKKKLPHFFTAAEMEALLNHAEKSQHRLVMLLMWRAGLRVSEAISIEPKHIHLDDDAPTIEVRGGKGGKDRVIPVHSELATALRGRLDWGADDDGPLIAVSPRTVLNWVKAAYNRAVAAGDMKPKAKCNNHMLRHAFGRHCALNHVPLNEIQKMMGHTSLTHTAIYLELGAATATALNDVP